MKAPDPNSNRSKRRKNRLGSLPSDQSRPNRRAKQRLASKMAIYDNAIKSPNVDDSGYHKPGAMKRW